MVHHNKDVFGADADLFRPEQWLDADDEGLQATNRVLDLVFGAGRYACFGKPVAMVEVSKVIAEIFRRNEIVLIDPANPWQSVNRNGLSLQSNLGVRIGAHGSFLQRRAVHKPYGTACMLVGKPLPTEKGGRRPIAYSQKALNAVYAIPSGVTPRCWVPEIFGEVKILDGPNGPNFKGLVRTKVCLSDPCVDSISYV
ncbi:hypothetical protein VTN77DRAFT_2192 [Rasamsonia byssochlamydoides]|uniref:uncharacterized protein n=1 Tax=Rasamsonia byssochlamydoides TaxID=89139 RepID=UPI003743C3BA